MQIMKQSKTSLKVNQIKIKKISDFLNENKIIILLFIFSTLFFLYQRSANFSWDFCSYVLNAKYWFAQGTYFEPFRPPLMPFIMGILSFFGWKSSEYLYIVLVSFLFMVSSVKLAESLKLNKNIFYLLSLNSYVFLTGLINGTELLSLSFLELFIAYLIKNKNSGIFLGLSSLSRYTCISFFPLLLFHRNIKSIIKNFILFVIPFLPWFLYNYIKFGNMFMGIADSYANNIYFRNYIHQSINYMHLIYVVNFLLPFFLFGLIITLFKIFKSLKDNNFIYNWKKFIEKNIADILMILILIFSLYGYFKIPIKSSRYIFNMILPTVYFSIIGINSIKIKKLNFKRLAVVIIIFLNLFLIFQYFTVQNSYKKEVYVDALKNINEMGIGNNCSFMSNSWVFLNYLERKTSIFPRKQLVPYYVNEGHYMLFFNHISEPSYVHNETFMSGFPIILKNEDYILIGNNNCTEIRELDRTYMTMLNETVYTIQNESTETNPCNILFSNQFIKKTCKIINFK